MLKKNKKGMALITVVVVMVVLTILGISLLGVSLAEVKHAELEDRRIQAHYVGRSGVYVGLKMLNNKLAAEEVNDINTLVTGLNSDLTTGLTDTFTVGDKGSFTLKYEVFESTRVKIRSVGTVSGNPNVSDTVTCAVKITPAISLLGNPDLWIAGINLRHSVKPSDPGASYLGRGVMLTGRPIQSPMGGDSDSESIFQASIIYFRDNNGLCLKQITNCIEITFDAEILYFESGVQLNKTNDPVILAISPETIKYRMDKSGVLPQYCPPGTPPPVVGFEYYERYKDFIGDETRNAYIDYATKFESSANYGVVYFGGDVVIKEKHNEAPILKVSKGYYYFKNGINLRDLDPGSLGSDLIKIPEDDAIIKAIRNLFRRKTEVEDAIWDRK